MKYIIYRRVSTRKQGDSGLGLDAQDRDINLFLQNYESSDYQVLDSFVDIESGAHDDRPQLIKAMELARKTGATLLVSKLDRLSRKVSFIASLLEDKYLTLKVACMPNADKFQLHIYTALAEQERDFISARTKAALKEAKARGTQLGGLRDKTHQRNQAARQQAQYRAERLRALVLPMVELGKTTRLIADALNRAGILTSRGNRWQSGQVSRLINRLVKK